jgi:tight adherence protein C
MLYYVIGLVFISVVLLLYSVLIYLFRDKLELKKRIEEVKNLDNNKKIIDEEELSFGERVIKPIYDLIINMFLKLTPKYKKNNFAKKLESAGLLKNSTTEKWIFIKTMIIIIISSVFAMFIYLVEQNILKVILMTIFIILFINAIFRFYIEKKVALRKNNITKELPFTLDLITVSVEAGLSFDGAIARVVNNIKGDLSDEFSKTLKEIRMGIEKKVALRNMSNRVNIKELSMLITSLIQADELGVSLGKVLRIEAAQLRERRKQAAREKAMKAPVKILFPLIFFIFPAIFIVILGPTVVTLVTSF